MPFLENRRLLREGAAMMGVHLTESMVDSFMDYMDLLLSWNEKMNLTTITLPRDVILKHFLDSLTLLKEIPAESGLRVVDIGTGAGFPGVPLAIARPGLNVTLLDSLHKRILFLQQVAESLRLKNVVCVHIRAEDAGKNPVYRQVFDVGVSRAVANMSTLAEYCLPFVKIDGKFISMKGPETKDEMNDAKTIIELLGGRVSKVETVKIPFTDINHSIIVINKLFETPAKFPRKPGKIPKNPTT